MSMPTSVTREHINWCYKLFLGREPASQEIADTHLLRPSVEHLRAFFATHAEFKAFQTTLAQPSAPEVAAHTGRLDYVIDRIKSASFSDAPFRHMYLENVFTDEDFAELISQPEILVPPVDDDRALITELYRRNFKAIPFPGTTTDLDAYLAWHADPSAHKHENQATCESYGVVMRLQKVRPATILDEANALFSSDRFWNVAAEKFGVRLSGCRRDFGLQKYLDGYEISPHPDIRSKALTFMLNVNPAQNSESIAYHTHYLTFEPEREYVGKYWAKDLTTDRSWVPWGWCKTQKTQPKNNSIVMFSPSNETLHAVKASYDHLQTQRTQFYGNLWYEVTTPMPALHFKVLDALPRDQGQ